ncbi:unnamed protein product [Diatraea saccharalis]|uniref:FAM194 C-terminal domain-containing protein n=1 Tax=Diatraea saccharalis TaxID=40085 RepID=A0A9N9WDV7_9NEOP|nr:unnamed protein product [Diatraea saccharalis]
MCIDTIENLTESKDILEEVISKLGKHNPFADTCGVVSCPKICKKIPDKKKLSNDNVNAPLSEVPVIDNTKKNVNSIEHDKVQKKKKSGITKKLNSKEHRKSIDDNSLSTFDKNLEETKIKDNIVKKEKPKRTSEDELMAKLMKSFKIQTEKTASEPKSVKIPQLPNIADLPTVQRKIPKKILDDPSVSESIVECDMLNSASKMMIKGTNVVPYKAAVPTNSSIIPILFESKLDFTTEGTVEVSDLSTEDSMKSKKKSKNEYESKNGGNIFKYMLSDQKFIERGWTMLPTTKILRRMNVYKMIPTNPQADWFKKHQNKRVTMYNTGEKFAEIYEDGKGRWYYKNGKLALDYYKLQGTKKDYRYVIYSSGENHDFGRNLPVTVLASFDSLGNGVVYDHYGNERLKYNQSEGLVVDEKIGPRGRWKWHTLNDPPVLTPVLVDTHVKLDKCFQNLGFRDDDDKSVTSRKNKQEPDDSMLTIELENFMKEKAHKLMQKFKPLHIKMKALKINNQFSLKILDQSNIYLMFRDGKMSIKLSLGLLLMSNEIIDSETSELSEVATVYDIWPPKSQSIADLQQTVEKARRLGKCHAKLRR